MMQQSISILLFIALIINPTTLASPFSQLYPNSQTSEIHNEYLPNDNLKEFSYNSGDIAIDSNSPNPVSAASNPWMDWLHGKFLLPSPPSWLGNDNSIAPEFTCDRFSPYCCTGKYIRRKGWVLGPCFDCLYHTYSPQLTSTSNTNTDMCGVIQIVRERMTVRKYLICTAAPGFLRYYLPFISTVSRVLKCSGGRFRVS